VPALEQGKCPAAHRPDETERLTCCEDEFDTLEKITRKIRDVNRPPSGPGL